MEGMDGQKKVPESPNPWSLSDQKLAEVFMKTDEDLVLLKIK